MEYHPDYIRSLVRLNKSLLENLRDFRYSKNVENISHQLVVPHASYSPWIDDSDFTAAYEKIKLHTLVDRYRCYELWQFAKQACRLDGAFVEIGVWRGGTGALLALSRAIDAPQPVVKLFDTFCGVVKSGGKDTLYVGGEHADTSFDLVRGLLQELSLQNVELHKGVFPEDFNLDQFPAVALCHIDVDTYQSAKECFDAIWPKLCVGGAIIFDDFGFWGCEGVTRLVMEINQEPLLERLFIHNLNGHGIFFKISN